MQKLLVQDITIRYAEQEWDTTWTPGKARRKIYERLETHRKTRIIQMKVGGSLPVMYR